MRILFLVGQLGPGGQEKQLFLLSSELKRQAHEVHVAVWNEDGIDIYSDRLKKAEIPVFYLKEFESKKEKIHQLIQLVRSANIEVIQSFTFYLNPIVWWIGRRTGRARFGALRSAFSFNLNRGRISGIIAGLLPAVTISNNHTGASELKSFFSFLSFKKVKTIWNSTDVPDIVIEKSSDKEIRSLSVGTVIDYKRVDIIVDSIVQLLKDGYSVRHTHIGDGPERHDLIQKVKDQGMEDSISLPGVSEDVNAHLLNSNLFIHASTTEGCPNVILEAMSHGLPVVSTRCGDAVDLLAEDRGRLVDINDQTGMYNELKAIIEDLEGRSRLAQKAYEFAKQNFGHAAIAEEYLSFYNDRLHPA